MIDDFILEGGELGPVFLKCHVFREACEGRWCFEDHEIIYLGAHLVETDFEPVELGVDHEEVVYFSFLGAIGIGSEGMGGT